jgi:hypothetical protein
MNPALALTHERLLREAAKIGDFRELTLSEPWQYEALRVVCWLNTVERDLFYKPFESTISAADGEEDGDGKFTHFLVAFEGVLRDPADPMVQQQSAAEYDRVVREYGEIHGGGEVQREEALGLVLVRTPQPGHYYSLFSATHGSDIVLACYAGGRFELEIKYTT